MTGKARILIADDEPHIRRILQFLLEDKGFEVCLAEDGQEALEALATFRPNLVLLDVMMPKADGFSVLQAIRSGYETSSLPVIMLTAKGETTDKVKGLQVGANDYVIKPFDHDELLLRVSNLLDSTRREREANPLTGLPGNRAIDREISRRIENGVGFGFMYVDIDRFKSFNDHYGYSRGDQAITYLSNVLFTCSREFGDRSDFIGHVGGDDFVVITALDHAEALARKFILEFDEGIGALHDEQDYERGYLEVKNRTGQTEKFPLITITVAMIADEKASFEHPAQLSDIVAELKAYGKTMPHSVVVRDRRSTSEAPELVASGNTHNTSS